MTHQSKIDPALLSSERSNKKNAYYNVAVLKSFLKEHNASTSGSKADLVDRLRQIMDGTYVKPVRSPRAKSPRAKSPRAKSPKLDYFYVTLIYDVSSDKAYDEAYEYWFETGRKAPIAVETEDRITYISNNGPDKANLEKFERDLDRIVNKTKGIEKIEHMFLGIDSDYDEGSYRGQVVMFIYLKVYYTPELFRDYPGSEYSDVVSDILNYNDIPDSGYIFDHQMSHFRGEPEFEEADKYFY